MGGAARRRRRALPRADRVPVRALGLLPRQARAGGLRRRAIGRRAPGHRPPPPHRQARDPGDVHAGQPDRRAPVRDGGGDRPDLLDQRHDRHAELHPAHGERPGELDHGIGAQLRGLRHRGRPAHRLHLQRRPVRGGRGAGLVRPHRPDPHPGRHRQQRSPDHRDRPAQAAGRRAHAVLRRVPDRDGRRSRLRPARVERRSRAGRRRARRRRAGLPRPAREGLGREGDRGDGHRRHRRLAMGRVRAAGRDAPRRSRLRPRRADRSRDGRRDRDRRRRHRRARPYAPATPGRAAPALPNARPRPGAHDARARAAGRARACAASAAPTTC